MRAGLTLIEVLVTLALLVFLTGLAAPLLYGRLAGARFEQAAASVTDAVADARADAMRTGLPRVLLLREVGARTRLLARDAANDEEDGPPFDRSASLSPLAGPPPPESPAERVLLELPEGIRIAEADPDLDPAGTGVAAPDPALSDPVGSARAALSPPGRGTAAFFDEEIDADRWLALVLPNGDVHLRPRMEITGPGDRRLLLRGEPLTGRVITAPPPAAADDPLDDDPLDDDPRARGQSREPTQRGTPPPRARPSPQPQPAPAARPEGVAP